MIQRKILILVIFFIHFWGGTSAWGYEKGWFYGIVAGVSDYKGELSGTSLKLDDAALKMTEVLKEFAIKSGHAESRIKIITLFDIHISDPKQKFTAKDVKEILEKTPTSSNILEKLEIGASRTRNKNDSLVFYFTGHGSSDVKDMYYHASGSDGDSLERTLTFSDIQTIFNESEAGIKLIFLDTCQSRKKIGTGNNKVLPAVNEATKQYTPPNGMATFFSTSPGQKSYIDQKLKYGYFTKHLVEGLLGKANGWNGRAFSPEYNDDRFFAEELRDYLYIKVINNLTLDSPFSKRKQEPMARIGTSVGKLLLYQEPQENMKKPIVSYQERTPEGKKKTEPKAIENAQLKSRIRQLEEIIESEEDKKPKFEMINKEAYVLWNSPVRSAPTVDSKIIARQWARGKVWIESRIKGTLWYKVCVPSYYWKSTLRSYVDLDLCNTEGGRGGDALSGGWTAPHTSYWDEFAKKWIILDAPASLLKGYLHDEVLFWEKTQPLLPWLKGRHASGDIEFNNVSTKENGEKQALRYALEFMGDQFDASWDFTHLIYSDASGGVRVIATFKEGERYCRYVMRGIKTSSIIGYKTETKYSRHCRGNSGWEEIDTGKTLYSIGYRDPLRNDAIR